MVYIDGSKRAGWDDLYEDCFEGINQIIEDNLELKHNDELINNVFYRLIEALNGAEVRMQNLEGGEELKKEWFVKLKDIKDYAKNADSPNKKVIAITIIDQFLRATY
ncbi:MAG: hypothetical protein WC796_05000 [Candidatus Pacearchaeota archaeon]|jgi:hypothetical protein